jgi:hypothetical protein
MKTKPGRTMVGVQLLLQNDPQFKELGPIFFWLVGGLPPRPPGPRLQPTPVQDENRTDEAENKAKPGE